jgi:hypothetical protein
VKEKKRAVYLEPMDWGAVLACLRTAHDKLTPNNHGPLTTVVLGIGKARIRYIIDEIELVIGEQA